MSVFNKVFLRLRDISCVNVVVKHYCSSASVLKSSLGELRRKTGYPLINCRKALEKFNNDISEAEKWLKENAAKEGWERALKLQRRPMSQGLIGVFHEDSRATLLEVNCETDFVARNLKFQELVARLVRACHSHFSQSYKGNQMVVKSETISSINVDGQSVADTIATEIGVIGENMVARRAVHLSASPDATLATYTHLSGMEVPLLLNCKFGKYAAVVEVKKRDPSVIDDDFDEVAQSICQHVLGMNPSSIGDPPEISNVVDSPDSSRLEENRSEIPVSEDILNDTIQESTLTSKEDADPSKDAKLNDTISGSDDVEEVYEIDEDMAFEDIVADDIREDSLLRQAFLLDESMKVAEYLDENSVDVLSFVRLECGEETSQDI